MLHMLSLCLRVMLNNTVVDLCSLKQNEEVLKKCAQEYLVRVKQEEQRYQTLKLHAEEKLDKYVEILRKLVKQT